MICVGVLSQKSFGHAGVNGCCLPCVGKYTLLFVLFVPFFPIFTYLLCFFFEKHVASFVIYCSVKELCVYFFNKIVYNSNATRL